MGYRKFQEIYDSADAAIEGEYERVMLLAQQELPDYFEEALEADNEKLYSRAIFDLEMTQLTDDQFSQDNFDLLMRVFKDARFLKSANGWVIFSVLENDKEKLSAKQIGCLLDTLAEVYEKFDNWMSCFSISEHVGDIFPAEQTFEFFQQFSNSSYETARAFVPHGFEHAIRNSTDENLTSKIWRSLRELEHCDSLTVQSEVQESLHRLAAQGFVAP